MNGEQDTAVKEVSVPWIGGKGRRLGAIRRIGNVTLRTFYSLVLEKLSLLPDGGECVAIDALGNHVETFIVNGRVAERVIRRDYGKSAYLIVTASGSMESDVYVLVW